MSGPAFPRFQLELSWFEAISIRTSRRRFDGRPVGREALERIEGACRRISEAAGAEARAVLVDMPPEGVFKGLLGSYGKAVSGAPAFVAFVGRDDRHLAVGFTGEAVILEATAAGLDTCWIAGSFDPAGAAAYLDLPRDERVYAVTPLGYATRSVAGGERILRAFVKADSRLDLERVAPGVGSWPPWAREAAQAVRLAPSGHNGQPWRLRLEGAGLVLACVSESAYWTAPIDCGIAALHAELAALQAGVEGQWEGLAKPDVARFVPA